MVSEVKDGDIPVMSQEEEPGPLLPTDAGQNERPHENKDITPAAERGPLKNDTIENQQGEGVPGSGERKRDGGAVQESAPAVVVKRQHTERDIPSNSLKGSFVKDLIPMMIGFGDDESPSMETVDFVEDAVVSYAVRVLTSALNLAKQRGRVKASTGKPMGPPTAEDVITVVRKDSRKVRRVEELLIMQKEIKIIQDMEKTDEEALAQQFS